MKSISAPLRISLALACLALCILSAGRSLGILPDASKERLRGRIALCEALAVGCSSEAARGDLDGVRLTLQSIVGRNEDLYSASLLARNGRELVRVVDESAEIEHAENLQELRVPLYAREKLWGEILLAFASRGRGPLSDSILMVLLAATMCVAFYWYLRRVLKHLNPAKVIPKRVRATLDTLVEGLLVLNRENRIVLANAAFSQTIGEHADSLQGRSVDDLPWHAKEKDTPASYPWSAALDDGEAHTGHFVGLTTPSKAARTFLVNAAPVRDDNGSCHGVLASFDDVTEIEQRNTALQQMLGRLAESRDKIRQQNKELHQLATRDPLTQCLNRRAYFEVFENHFAAAARYENAIVCILADIDHFKSINDQHGHAVGDDVLKAVASALSEQLRESDSLCRYGGEEFCVLLPRQDIDQGMITAERLRAAVERLEVGGLSVTASFGVSSNVLGAADPQQLIQQADEALYAAKRNGRNQVCRWDQMPAEVEQQELMLTRTAAAVHTEDELPIPFNSVKSLFSVLSLRDGNTAQHCRRVADLCVAAAREVMNSNDIYVLEVAALLHEVGKIGLPDSILRKRVGLTPPEAELVRLYDRVGVELVKSTLASKQLVSILEQRVVPFHRIAGSQGCVVSPLGARILRIADIYDQMVYPGSRETAISQDEAVAELRRRAGDDFDPGLVERFVRSLVENDRNRGCQPLDSKEFNAELHAPALRESGELEDTILGELKEIAAHLSETSAAYCIVASNGEGLDSGQPASIEEKV